MGVIYHILLPEHPWGAFELTAVVWLVLRCRPDLYLKISAHAKLIASYC